MFTVDQRARLRARLEEQASKDDAIVGAAFTGSQATTAGGDRWSDTDLVLAVRGDLGSTVARWTRWLHEEFDVQHHWDLTAAPAVIRVFLLRHWLELDLTFAPESGFGPRGPQWHTIFGRAEALEPFPAPDPDTLAGLVWHHALHAWICLRRDRRWQAEQWIGALRGHVITLACLRLGLPTSYAKGAHLLPDEITAPLEATLVRALTTPELRRALIAVVGLATEELEQAVSQVASRLRPMLLALLEDTDGVRH